MRGDIRARVIVIEGKVEGNLYASESVHIRATAKVRGNLLAPRIAIQEGAFFQGQVQMQPGTRVQERGALAQQPAVAGTPLEGAAVDRLLRWAGS
jgi:cytoskeletal protein CcmA (bactofilin family)